MKEFETLDRLKYKREAIQEVENMIGTSKWSKFKNENWGKEKAPFFLRAIAICTKDGRYVDNFIEIIEDETWNTIVDLALKALEKKKEELTKEFKDMLTKAYKELLNGKEE